MKTTQLLAAVFGCSAIRTVAGTDVLRVAWSCVHVVGHDA